MWPSSSRAKNRTQVSELVLHIFCNRSLSPEVNWVIFLEKHGESSMLTGLEGDDLKLAGKEMFISG